MAPPIHDSFRRSLCIIATASYAPDSGLGQLNRVHDEVADVRSTFSALGFSVEQQKVLLDQSATRIRAELNEWLRTRRSDDVVAIYVTGHGEILGEGVESRLYLHTVESRRSRPVGTIKVDDLLDGLGEIEDEDRPRNVFLVLDVCAAEAGVREAGKALARWLPARFVEPGASTGTYVVATARRVDQARAGAFAGAWRAVVEAPDVAPRSVPYLELAVLLQRVQESLSDQVVIPVVTGAKGPNVCLANPRHHLTGIEWQEMNNWWDPNARAVRARDSETETLFTGRRRVNSRLVEWLTALSGEPGVVIVTAAPGSGKSTVLARLAALTIPDFRARFVPALDDDVTSRPPDGFAFTAAIPAQGMSTATVDRRVRTALGLPEGQSFDDLAPATEGSGPATILIDSVDEAESPKDLVREVLRPLARASRRGRVRLLVGTRRKPLGQDAAGSDEPGEPDNRGADLIALIGSAAPHEVLDLDTKWLEKGDISAYAERILSARFNEMGRPNPYADAPRARRRLARAIENESKHAFFLAGLVARSHTLDEETVDPSSPRWIDEFPRSIGGAFEEELTKAYGPSRARYFRVLLRPLAYAQGAGLPRDHMDGSDLWAALATDMCYVLDDASDVYLSAADVDRLLRERVASHVIANIGHDGRPAFRFHHAALRAHFGPPRERRQGHQAVTDRLMKPLGDASAADAPWERITGYMRRALPWHARLADHLPGLSQTAGFLTECDPVRMHDELTRCSDTHKALSVLRRVFRGLLHRLPGMDPRRRAALLAWECLGEPVLRDRVAGLERQASDGLRRLLAVGQDESGHMTVELGETVPMSLLAAPRAQSGTNEIPDQVVAVAAGIETFLIDPGIGVPLLKLVDPDNPGLILALTYGWDAEGFAFLATGGRRLVLWEPSNGAPLVAGPDQGDLIRSVVAGAAGNGTPFVAATSGTHVWAIDPGGGSELWRHDAERAVLAVTSTAPGETGLVVAGWERVIMLDPISGELRATVPITGMPRPVVATMPRLEASNLLAIGGSNGVAVWNPGDGQVHVVPGMPSPDPAIAGNPLGVGQPFLCVAQANGSVLVWDPIGRRAVSLLSGHQGLVEMIASGVDQAGEPLLGVATAGYDQVSVYNPLTGRQVLHESVGASISALGIGQRPDGSAYLVSGSPRSVQFRDVPSNVADSQCEARDQVATLAATRSGSGELLVVTSGLDVDVTVWTHDGGPQVLPGAGPTAALAATTSAGGIMAVVTMADDYVARLWDVESRKLRRAFELFNPDDFGHGERHLDVVFDDVRGTTGLVAGGGRGRVRVWALDTGSLEWELELPGPGKATPGEHVTAVALSSLPDGTPFVVAGASDGSVTRRILDEAGSTSTVHAHGGITSLVTGLTAAGRPFFAAGGRTGGPVVWDAQTGELIVDLDAEDGWVSALAALDKAGGGMVVAACMPGADGAVMRVWDPDTGDLMFSDDLTDLSAGTVHLGSYGGDGEEPILVTVGGEDVVVTRNQVRTRIPLPSRARAAVIEGDILIVASRAGFLAARLPG